MKRIVYTRSDGGITILILAPGARRKGESEEEFVNRIQQKDVPKDALAVRIVDESEVPTDRTFRNAWKSDLTVDMPKARDIHRDRLRQIRAPLFEPIERAQRTALVAGDALEARRLESSLQALRDVTADAAIEAARTPEELKAAIPAALR